MSHIRNRVVSTWFLLLLVSLVGTAHGQENWPSTTTGIAVLTVVSVVVAGLAAGIIYAICREMGNCNESKVAPLKVNRERRQVNARKTQSPTENANNNNNNNSKSSTYPAEKRSERPIVDNKPYQAELQNSTDYSQKPYGGYDDRGNIVGLRVV